MTSILGDAVDRAPNRETGDGCVHPRATTETLVQARVAITGLAFIASMSVPGGFGSILGEPTAAADQVCQEDARVAGSPTPAVSSPAVHQASDPASHIVNPSFGPIQAPDGTTVAASISDLANCSPSRNACLLAPINKDIHGNQVTDDINIWTAALPDGAINGDSSTNCQDWTSNSAFDTGIGGTAGSTSIGFTTRMHDTCDNTHRLMCL